MEKSLEEIIREGQETHKKAREAIDEFDKVNAEAESLMDVIERGQNKFKDENEKPTFRQQIKKWFL